MGGTFRSINRKTTLSLFKQFPKITKCDGDFDLVMNAARITIFDHYLNVEEVVNLLDNVDSIERYRRDEIWRTFNKLLVTSSPCYYVKWVKSPQRLLFKEPSSIDKLLVAMEPSDNRGLLLAFPELGVLYQQYWDDTHLLYFLNKDAIQPLMDIARKSGLNVLPW